MVVSTSIKSTLQKFDSNLWYYYVEISKQKAAAFIRGNNKRIVCTLNNSLSFQAALMPLGNGHFFININQEIRTKLKVKEGDELTIKLASDNSEYGLPLCNEFKELLKQDIEGSDIFHALTPGKQRTLIYIVGKPKSSDLRIRNAIAVLFHLKQTKGKIDYKQLNVTIKNGV